MLTCSSWGLSRAIGSGDRRDKCRNDSIGKISNKSLVQLFDLADVMSRFDNVMADFIREYDGSKLWMEESGERVEVDREKGKGR